MALRNLLASLALAASSVESTMYSVPMSDLSNIAGGRFAVTLPRGLVTMQDKLMGAKLLIRDLCPSRSAGFRS